MELYLVFPPPPLAFAARTGTTLPLDKYCIPKAIITRLRSSEMGLHVVQKILTFRRNLLDEVD